MKKIILFFAAAMLLTAIGCSSDDGETGDLTSVGSNPVEDTVLDAATVSEGVSILGGQKIATGAPTPNGEIAAPTLATTEQSAFLASGFEIEFDAPANYAGSYIQFKSTDGTIAPGYFDIPAIGSNFPSKNNFLGKAIKMNENYVDIDVNFNEKVTPGTFCYLICIYDEAGNISLPVEVCVEVEAWGGNANLTGVWSYIKQIENGETTILAGEEECDEYERTITCTNEETIVINKDYCDIIDSLVITFNEDGTYEYTSIGSYTSLDYTATQEACAPVFGAERKETDISKGNWAYDEEEKRLTLVEFSYKDDNGGEISEGTNEDGDLVFEGAITLTGSEFTIVESYTELGITETYQYFFSK